MVQGIHHINFIVRDLTTALPVWERILNRPVTRFDRLAQRNVELANFDVDGIWIVLVQPTGPGVPADHLAAHGEGFFLLSFGVDSLDAECARLGEAMLSGAARSGLDNWTVQDLQFDQTRGAQLQLVQEGVVKEGSR